MKLNTIEEAIKDLKNNKVIIVVDDENRENEGDFIYPAEIITPEIVNFMATHGRGLICVPLTSDRCRMLNLDPMVQNNTELMKTAFTISVDLKGNGVTSGISASDRSKTIKALVDLKTKPSDLVRPGHIFPLSAKDGGVLRRTGHWRVRAAPAPCSCREICFLHCVLRFQLTVIPFSSFLPHLLLR